MTSKIVLAMLAVIIFATHAAAQAPMAQIGATTLQPGFEITTAFHNFDKRDGEAYTRVLNADTLRFLVNYTNTLGTVSRREILRGDRQNAKAYVIGFSKQMPLVMPGTTSVGLSANVFQELKKTGQANWGLMIDTSGKILPGRLSLVKKTRYRIVINNKVADIPALHAKGFFKAGKTQAIGEFYIVDGIHNPLMLRYNIKLGGQNIRSARDNRPIVMNVVRLNTGLSQRATLEQTLRTMRRFELYGIHFNFASASLRPGVRSLVADIAATLKNNPAWRLSIQGHTDSIGGANANQLLSQRRAQAIKTALIRTHKIKSGRLKVVGFGLTRPKATNDTLEGRAMNRRVELVRLDNAN